MKIELIKKPFVHFIVVLLFEFQELIKMKKTISIFVVFLLLQSSCREINKLTIFNVSYQTQSVIESLAGINLPFNILTPVISTNSVSEFEINDTRKDMIEEITLKELKLTVSAPENGDLSFLKSMKVYINGQGLNEKLLAWNENIDSEEKSIFLKTTAEDLQEYIKLDTISLRVNAEIKKLILSDYTLDINSVFRVDARILGI